jgi:hypothetical protein
MASNQTVDFEPDLRMEMADVRVNPVRPAVPVKIDVDGTGYSETFNDVSSPQLQLGYGTYEFRFRRPGFKSVTQEVTINDDDWVVSYDLEPKNKFASVAWSAILPGSGQYYWGNRFRGTLFLTAFAAAAGLTVNEIYALFRSE